MCSEPKPYGRPPAQRLQQTQTEERLNRMKGPLESSPTFRGKSLRRGILEPEKRCVSVVKHAGG